MTYIDNIKDMTKDRAISYGKKSANEILDNQEKFQETLDKIRTNEGFKKLNAVWDACDDADKKKVYVAGQQVSKNKVLKVLDPLGVVQTTKSVDPTLVTLQALRYKNNKLKALKMLIPGQTFEPTMRLLVQLGLCKKPGFLTTETLLSDMQIDFKALNVKLTAFEAVATVVPYLRPILPLIQVLKQYAKKLGEASIQKLASDQILQEEVRMSPENMTNDVLKTTNVSTTTLNTNIDEDKIKNDIIQNITSKSGTTPSTPAK